MKCPKCNTKNPDDSKYCRECGTPLKPSKDVSVTKTLQIPTKGLEKGSVIAKKYKIIAKVGEGGMGVVYKAKDMRLDRTVALKFLPPELTKDEEAKKRFIQEAKAAAALDHPNICIVHEIDESDGQTFIAMSFIEGQSLKDKLKDGPLSIDEAKDIAIQVAEGLREAHDKGIVHRDIKPANIMLTAKGQAKITDFGLAKLSWGVDLTRPSTIMGTVTYMSPEQAKGQKVDHRTDIWSFGCVLYEMFSGERPFKSAKDQAVFYSILNEEPEPVTSIRQDVSKTLGQIVLKALEKNPARRQQSMEEVLENLRAAQSATSFGTEPKKSIIVLPFVNMSPDADQEFFSDGLTEEIISDLSSVHSLRVISRTSTMMLKGTRKSMQTISRELDVQYVLEGSVRKSGNNLRITAQLIDAANDAHLWAKKYSGTLDDVFDIQEKVSRSIVDELKLKLSPEENQKISEHPIENSYAFEAYLRARYDIWHCTEDSISRALKYLQEALDIVGDNVLLYAAIAEAYFYLPHTGKGDQDTSLRKMEEYADKIFELEEDSAYGHFVLGLARSKMPGRWKECLKHYKKAYTANPNEPSILLFLGFYLAQAGKLEEAYPIVKRAIEIDPLSALSHMIEGWYYFLKGDFEHAIVSTKKSYEIERENPQFCFFYAYYLAHNHQIQETHSIVDEAKKNMPDNAWTWLAILLDHSIQNNKKEALKSVSPDLEKTARWDETMSMIMAENYALLNENTMALDWLENAANRGFINYPFLNEIDPFLENIRGEERFKKLMERVKHEWENFEV